MSTYLSTVLLDETCNDILVIPAIDVFRVLSALEALTRE